MSLIVKGPQSPASIMTRSIALSHPILHSIFHHSIFSILLVS